ncbi:transglycosylase domain-containing protein [Streptantibioticus silvisoli]|uniref:Transglycosylase domain-containing protein n=1 Tax=Streptantibioticus silvisoli TaxID=2705255 RepID=A0ABT6W8W9_9ACTN|nr:transglycosylase domain-containing protein [Streptantibioticus silvisoli]MDI5966805.1 transglycosylase domain-containing protein [Streptantibioticus silvisoli]
MSSDDPPPPPARPPSPEPGRADRPARRAARRAARRRHGWRRLVPTWRIVTGGLLLAALLLGGAFAAGYLLVGIPAANATATAQSNVYLYADGRTQIASSGAVNRENIPLREVPATMQRAALAAEDRDFYHEDAIDPRAMLRAGWNTVSGKGKQSGSTITQQYVKNYYLNQEQTVSRKVEEFFISLKLDHEHTKDDILQGYLNTSYFGRNAYGIQAAAQAYYHLDAAHLDTARAAYLASLLNAPSAYDVVANPQNRDRAVARWNYVLDGMVKEHWLAPAARARMRFPAPDQVHVPPGLSGQRGYLVEAVRAYLLDHHVLAENSLDSGGYRITTTIDKPRQDAFSAAARAQLLNRLRTTGPDRYVRVGGASVDPATGHVVALYGGVDYTRQFVDNATRRDYQVGSTFKPYVFAAAVQHHARTQDGRIINPGTHYDGANHRPVDGARIAFAPANEDNRSYGDITVSDATNKSVNAVYAQMAQDVGPANVEDTAVALGIPPGTPSLSPYPSIALGVATASPLDMAQGYATLDNHGVYRPDILVTRVERDGRTVKLPDGTPQRAISREAADTTTAMLEDVVDAPDGTGTAAQDADRPAAGKTGTAEDDKAAWFAGYTPDLVTVVAVMGQDSTTGRQEPLYGATGLGRVNGGGYPARIWADYTAAALGDRPSQDFDLDMMPGADDGYDEPWGGDDPTDGPSDDPSDTPGDDTTPRHHHRPTAPPTDDPTGGDNGDGTGDDNGDDNGGDGRTGDDYGGGDYGGNGANGGDSSGGYGDGTGGDDG